MFSGLHVPVHEAPLVRVVQRPRHGLRHRPRLRHRHSFRVVANTRLQIPARHQGHDVEELAFALPELVHRDDVGVGELGRRPHLPLEALDPVWVAGKLRRHGLQRHLPAQALVLGPVDVRHAPPAEEADDAVVAQSSAGSPVSLLFSHNRCPWLCDPVAPFTTGVGRRLLLVLSFRYSRGVSPR